MEKEKLSFQVDDPELLDFIYSLGRERSKIINFLLKECMEEGDGYVPLRIMAATGFSYKNKRVIKKGEASSVTKLVKKAMSQDLSEPITGVASVIDTISKQKSQSESTRVITEPVISVKAEPVIELPKLETIVSKPAVSSEAENGYVSSAPKIQNEGLLRAGLAGLGLI